MRTKHDSDPAFEAWVDGADQQRRLYAPVLDRPWAHQATDYNGNAAIATDAGMYVCSVPHEVARRIVEDHNSALGRSRCSKCGSRLDPDGTCPLAWEEAQFGDRQTNHHVRRQN